MHRLSFPGPMIYNEMLGFRRLAYPEKEESYLPRKGPDKARTLRAIEIFIFRYYP
jgi:hypothetical protein